MTTRIGPQMQYLSSCVNNGESILSLVSRCYRTRNSGRCSTMYGYRVVWRAVKAGLIVAKKAQGRGGYALYTPEAV